MHQWPFLILADPERKVYGYFQLARLPWCRVFSLATIRFYIRLVLKGKKLENYGRDDYRQSGGDFLVDSEGKIVFAHRSHDPTDRPTVRTLLAAADRMRRENRPV
jgi:AhpC/TSA antioxidant enzyme